MLRNGTQNTMLPMCSSGGDLHTAMYRSFQSLNPQAAEGHEVGVLLGSHDDC